MATERAPHPHGLKENLQNHIVTPVEQGITDIGRRVRAHPKTAALAAVMGIAVAGGALLRYNEGKSKSADVSKPASIGATEVPSPTATIPILRRTTPIIEASPTPTSEQIVLSRINAWNNKEIVIPKENMLRDENTGKIIPFGLTASGLHEPSSKFNGTQLNGVYLGTAVTPGSSHLVLFLGLTGFNTQNSQEENYTLHIDYGPKNLTNPLDIAMTPDRVNNDRNGHLVETTSAQDFSNSNLVFHDNKTGRDIKLEPFNVIAVPLTTWILPGLVPKEHPKFSYVERFDYLTPALENNYKYAWGILQNREGKDFIPPSGVAGERNPDVANKLYTLVHTDIEQLNPINMPAATGIRLYASANPVAG